MKHEKQLQDIPIIPPSDSLFLRDLDCNGDKEILNCSRFGGLNDSFKVRLVYFFII